MNENLVLGNLYSKKELSQIFDVKGLLSSREGIFSNDNFHSYLFFVDLVKEGKEDRFHFNDYFDGDISAINGISVRQPGAAFSQAAWKAMRKVRAGAVISYADLADRAGSAAAVRAAGSACAKNAIMLVVPCHRIVKSGGALGNYAYGVNKKEWLLRHEGAL